jgi:hypothetical protein
MWNVGSIKITETSKTGDVSSTLEYEFSDVQDYFLWSEMKQDALNNALKSFSDSLLDTQDEVGENVTEIKVGKKVKEPTRH